MDAKAEFQKARHATDMKLKAKQQTWDAVNRKEAAALGKPVKSPKPVDSYKLWNEGSTHWATWANAGDDTDSDLYTTQGWQDGAKEVTCWGSFDNRWGNGTATGDKETQQQNEWTFNTTTHEGPGATAEEAEEISGIDHNMHDERDKTVTTYAASSLPTPPPSPKPPGSSLPVSTSLTSEQTLTRIGRLKADVHFEEHASKLLSSLRNLRNSRSVDTWDRHRTHRDSWINDDRIRDADAADYLARFTTPRTTAFNILPAPDRERERALLDLTGLAECRCRGRRVDGDAQSVETVLWCPFNHRRARQSRVTCACGHEKCVDKRCSSLRNGFTMEDVLTLEAVQISDVKV